MVAGSVLTQVSHADRQLITKKYDVLHQKVEIPMSVPIFPSAPKRRFPTKQASTEMQSIAAVIQQHSAASRSKRCSHMCIRTTRCLQLPKNNPFHRVLKGYLMLDRDLVVSQPLHIAMGSPSRLVQRRTRLQGLIHHTSTVPRTEPNRCRIFLWVTCHEP